MRLFNFTFASAFLIFPFQLFAGWVTNNSSVAMTFYTGNCSAYVEVPRVWGYNDWTYPFGVVWTNLTIDANSAYHFNFGLQAGVVYVAGAKLSARVYSSPPHDWVYSQDSITIDGDGTVHGSFTFNVGGGDCWPDTNIYCTTVKNYDSSAVDVVLSYGQTSDTGTVQVGTQARIPAGGSECLCQAAPLGSSYQITKRDSDGWTHTTTLGKVGSTIKAYSVPYYELDCGSSASSATNVDTNGVPLSGSTNTLNSSSDTIYAGGTSTSNLLGWDTNVSTSTAYALNTTVQTGFNATVSAIIKLQNYVATGFDEVTNRQQMQIDLVATNQLNMLAAQSKFWGTNQIMFSVSTQLLSSIDGKIRTNVVLTLSNIHDTLTFATSNQSNYYNSDLMLLQNLTNLAGQIATNYSGGVTNSYDYVLSNILVGLSNTDLTLTQYLSLLTNLTSNTYTITATNLTNISVSSDWTNYITSWITQGISNYFFGLLNTQSFDQQLLISNYLTSNVYDTNKLSQILSPISNMIPVMGSSDGSSFLGISSPDTFQWNCTLPTGQTLTFDFDPMHNAHIASVVVPLRNFLVWLITFAFSFYVLTHCYRVMDTAFNVKQLELPGKFLEFWRTVANLCSFGTVGTFSALACATFFVVFVSSMFYLVPVWLYAFTSGSGAFGWTAVSTTPLHALASTGPMAQGAVYLLDCFIPCGFILFCLTDYLIFILTSTIVVSSWRLFVFALVDF